MKKLFTFLFSAMTMASFAQMNQGSPFPADFQVLAPSAITGTYEYAAQTEDWGPQLENTLTGQVVWAYDETDSLCCTTAVVNDVAGKFALIRRGICNFSLKAYNAQQSGAIGAIICNHYATATDGPATIIGGMSAGTSAELVTIPAIFVSRATCEAIDGILSGGGSVDVSFTVRQFYNGITGYSYHTPLSQAVPVDFFSVNFVNKEFSDLTVSASATITAPSGATATLTGSELIAGRADSVITMEGAYTPEELGEYTVVFTNDINDDVLERKFEMTDYTWALDNGVIDRTAGPSDANFLQTYNLTYNIGSLVIAGPDGGIVTHASMGLANPGSLISGDPSADVVNLVLYDADADDNGVIDFAATGASFDDLTPVAIGTYSINAETPASELVVVPLESLTGDVVELEPGGAYYIVALYDGVGPGLGIAPQFMASAGVDYANFPTSPLFLDQLYSGWNNLSVAVQLHLDGFVTGAKDITPLADLKVKVLPNPASDFVNISFDLDHVASEVNIGILDINGQMLGQQRLENIHNETFRFDVSDFAAGTYVLSILTPEGYRAEKFTVIK